MEPACLQFSPMDSDGVLKLIIQVESRMISDFLSATLPWEIMSNGGIVGWHLSAASR